MGAVLTVLACGNLYAGSPDSASDQSPDSESISPSSINTGITVEQAMKEVYWIHHSSFLIEKSGKVIYIDSYNLKESKPADLIFITHLHPDHFSPEDIKKIYKKGTLIICPQVCAKKLKGYDVKIVKPRDNLEIGGITCEVVPAYTRYKPLHLKIFGFVGYIINIDGINIYHGGDTDFILEMKSFKNITIAMVPVGGKIYTMDAKEAAEAVKTINPKVAIPMHYGYTLSSKNGQEFKTLSEKLGIKAIIPEQEQ
jgi:L-ascorbate metabolism protein UlaG (beta-lactamase superfamily)